LPFLIQKVFLYSVFKREGVKKERGEREKEGKRGKKRGKNRGKKEREKKRWKKREGKKEREKKRGKKREGKKEREKKEREKKRGEKREGKKERGKSKKNFIKLHTSYHTQFISSSHTHHLLTLPYSSPNPSATWKKAAQQDP
jgi:hypothetical protein